eukprot:Nitzschia sp. Nitz4//scaffold4_size323378//235357//236619//NITZ4_000693-RA/size323378-processed-gene-0.301-mRNA-1//1//CDS//3329553498//2139//frame0
MGVKSMQEKVNECRELFTRHFPSQADPSVIAVAPGRVNLIGEHVDYTGGFVLPFAIDYSTVVVGTGSIHDSASPTASAKLKFSSTMSPDSLCEVDIDSNSTPPSQVSWTSYVVGTVFQYLADLPPSTRLELVFTISGDVPLGSGLSSSASLEVSVAQFVETILGTSAYSSDPREPAKVRALRCQKAENQWASSPCGLMDQYISSAGQAGSFLLIDCTSLDYHLVSMPKNVAQPVLVVANSNVQHDIAGGEYPVRVAQCSTATQALAQIVPTLKTLRDATMENVEAAKASMDDISYRRARHVVTENGRTLEARERLEQGDWKRVGELMNMSHASMRDDYEVSCEEIDYLVANAQKQKGVYGSRLTGGGFGGCTVTLVNKEDAESLMATLKRDYMEKYGKDCMCFVTQPSKGAHTLPVEMLR